MAKKREQKVEGKEEVKDTKKQKTEGLKIVETNQTGGVCVDPEFEFAKDYTVQAGKDGKPLSSYLSFTDLEKNSNKFYVIQIIAASTGKIKFHCRYGR
jgi:hypothetical protein